MESKCLSQPHHEFKLSSSVENFYYDGFESYEPSATLKENLKLVKLKNLIPCQEFIELLDVYLPDVYTFIGGDGRFGGFSRKKICRNYILDLACFKCLQVFYFDLGLVLKDPKIDSCYIKFEHIDGKEKYYRFVEKSLRLHPTTLKVVQTVRKFPTSAIVFRYEDIDKFTLYTSENSNVVWDIIQGLSQNSAILIKL